MRLGILIAVSWLGVAAVGAFGQAVPTMGWVEEISLEPWGFRLKAKLDTGARTSSLQDEEIERFECDEEEWIRFTIEVETVDDDVRRVRVERPRIRTVRIERRDEDEHRPVVEMVICLAGELHRAEFTVTDRDHLIYPVLLGRRFLSEVAAVDPAREFLTEPDCGKRAE